MTVLFSAAMLIAVTGNVYGEEPIEPIPIVLSLDPQKVSLGEMLFNDKRLSKDNLVSCASCHNITQHGGADGRLSAVGVGGAIGSINTPTVLNSGLNFRQFWDGRAATLEDQADGPVANPKEMASSWDEAIGKLEKDPAIVGKFKESYASGLNRANARDAIATYERSLTTPNSRFDKYLRGAKMALSADEIKGYQIFKNYGCVACHQGVNIGGNMYQTFGVMGDYFAARGNETEADLGRFNVTKNAEDKHLFKVPSLRNVALTAPYFHDGSAKTLSDAVNVMFKYQLGRSAPQQDKDLIVKFLRTLTGEYKGKTLETVETTDSK